MEARPLLSLSWHLRDALNRADLAWSAIAPTLPMADDTWLGSTPPAALTIADLAALCDALGCQPGDLLTHASVCPAAQAAHNLANDLFYQSFLTHREAQDDDLED